MAETPPYIRLFCEGLKTEPNYFNPYFKAKGFHQPNMASQPKNHSPKGVAKAAKEAYVYAKKGLNWTINPYTDVHLIFESLLSRGFITAF